MAGAGGWGGGQQCPRREWPIDHRLFVVGGSNSPGRPITEMAKMDPMAQTMAKYGLSTVNGATFRTAISGTVTYGPVGTDAERTRWHRRWKDPMAQGRMARSESQRGQSESQRGQSESQRGQVAELRSGLEATVTSGRTARW